MSSCRLALDEFSAAEQALNEAAKMDPENPSVWGQMALVALKAGRQGEAARALKVRSMSLGFRNNGRIPS